MIETIKGLNVEAGKTEDPKKNAFRLLKHILLAALADAFVSQPGFLVNMLSAVLPTRRSGRIKRFDRPTANRGYLYGGK